MDSKSLRSNYRKTRLDWTTALPQLLAANAGSNLYPRKACTAS